METTKNSDVRINNRKRVLNTLFREGGMTKHELAVKLEISPPTITLLLKELMDRGLISKGEVLGSTGGRKPISMTPVYDLKYSIGIEISSHEIRLVLVDLGANVLHQERYPYGIQESKEYWGKVSEILDEFILSNKIDDSKLLGIGISLQPSNGNTGKNKQEHISHLDMGMIHESFNYHVKIHSSAKMAAIAQIWNLNDRDNFVFVSLGSYVAGAMVYKNEIIDFDNENGEFGKVLSSVTDSKKISDYCIMQALCERGGVKDISNFFERIEEPKIKKLWDEYLDVLCTLLYNLYCIFGWKIVIGGSMSPYLEQYKSNISNKLNELCGNESDESGYIDISDLGEFGAAVGTALLPVDKFLESGFDEID
ncbi:MAG: ROK family protein [Suipraeoptans sp.]